MAFGGLVPIISVRRPFDYGAENYKRQVECYGRRFGQAN